VPTELVRENNAESVVNYMAYWAHGFFGIADGFVTEFRLATVSPDANGVFQVELPYFSADDEASPSRRRAGFWLMLRDSKTWNHIRPDAAFRLVNIAICRFSEVNLRGLLPCCVRFAPTSHPMSSALTFTLPPLPRTL
jgi:hypothetical protein